VIETWSRLSTQLGQRVTLSYNRRRFTGHCIGLDPEKGLILQLDRSGIRAFDAAHTHIIKRRKHKTRNPTPPQRERQQIQSSNDKND
jgi:hypothetical protein